METRPLISADGTILYFCRKHYPENINGEKDNQDIWSAHLLENGEWSLPENLGKPINNKNINAVVSINYAGEEGIFVNSYEKLSKNATNVLAKAHKTNEGWTAPEALTIKNFSNKSIFADFYFSYEENVLLLAIQKVDDKSLVGDQDLYISFPLTNGQWGEPVNLGKVVNTSRAEYAPFLGADGKSLFFVSEGHPGEGGSDIFYTKRLDDTWTRWSEPENLGLPINSKEEETYFSVTSDFEEVYFESYKKRALNRNIFKAKLPERFKPREEETIPTVAFTAPKEADTAPIANSEEMMTPEEEPVAASEITEQPANNPPSFSTATPNLPPKKEVNVPSSSVANKILSEFEKVHVANGGNAVAYMLLQNIYFDFNQAQIKEGYHTKLDKIHEILAEEPALMLEITGYADAVGGENINDEISQRRSESVSDYLTQKGSISPDRLVIHAYGEKYPMASNDDENEGRELNRRVELKFVQPFQSAVAQ
jgi:outer membrane protein OmpA-like peptidoglycan-associated protein